MITDILAAGCVFPSGPGIGLADVALRTGLALVRRHPFFVDRCGHRVQVSCFDEPGLGFDAARWPALAEAGLSDLVAQLEEPSADELRQRPWQAWLVLPDAARGADPERLYQWIEPVLANWPYALERVTVHVGGHAAGAAAVAAAAAACQAEPNLVALVLAVDSQLNADALSALEQRRFLHAAREPYEGAARANPYGRIPGEGAAALVLSAQSAQQPWSRLLGVALGQEPNGAGRPEPCTGIGLTDTARRAIAASGLGDASLSTLTHDATGEPYRADEFGFVALRLARRLAPDYQRITPALASGDLGAASAVAHVALRAWRCHRQPDGSAHLILSSSDDPLRGSIVLRAMAGAAQ